MESTAKLNQDVKGLLDFLRSSPSPFHAVASTQRLLEDAGFEEIKEASSWNDTCIPGGKYYLVRNGSAIIAFAIGKKWRPGNSFSIIGAHSDSPCLRIKPISARESFGYMQVGVEPYGKGNWHTWFDRDLGVAGRIVQRMPGGKLDQKLVHINYPVLRIPTLAVHIDAQTPFIFNLETEMVPIASQVEIEGNNEGMTPTFDSVNGHQAGDLVQPLKQRHPPILISLIAQQLSIDPVHIVDFELILADTQEPCTGGLKNDFVLSGRLDNLNMCYCAIRGLIDAVRQESALEEETSVRMVALFDHEEVGSHSARGAASEMLPSTLRRISMLSSTQRYHKNHDSVSENGTEPTPDSYERSLATSFLISADMAHGVHPNYSHKYELCHGPHMNHGIVIKVNANARYATDITATSLIQEVAEQASRSGINIPLQFFVTRNDMPCSTTIGPMLATLLGVRTVDLGAAQLSMHSIRECSGVKDVGYSIHFFAHFFKYFSDISRRMVM